VDQETALAALAALRTETLGRIAALERFVGSITDASEFTTHDDEHDPEGVTVGFERAQAQGLLAAARADLIDIDSAGMRVRSGTYGTCGQCGGVIAEQRLIALPATSTCIDCASRARR
jgi:RNA polymerase-binding transcription factor DksA